MSPLGACCSTVQPSLFADMGDIQPNTDVQGTFPAEDVMTGHCDPFPACATYRVSDCTSDKPGGCERIGDADKNDILNPIISSRVNTRGKWNAEAHDPHHAVARKQALLLT